MGKNEITLSEMLPEVDLTAAARRTERETLSHWKGKEKVFRSDEEKIGLQVKTLSRGRL